MIRPTRILMSLPAALAAGWLFTTPAGAMAAAPAQEPAMNCNLVVGTQYWFCRGLEGRNCNLVERNQYWLCMSLVQRDCNLAQRADYWTCKGLVERNCDLTERSGYWSCKGLVEHCDLSPANEQAFCRAVGGFFRLPQR